MKQARLLLSAAGWGVLVLQSFPARAADAVSPAADAAAQQAYQRAEVAYRAKDLPGALREMEQAYQLSQRADLLYNLARIEDELGQCTPARAHYRQYLERVPQGEARSDAQRADEQLAARCNDAAAPAPVVPAPTLSVAPPAPPNAAPDRSIVPEPSVDHGATQRWLGWSLVAGGVISGVGAAYFLDAAIGSRDAYQASINRQVAGGAPYDPSLEAQQHRHERTARALSISSAALLVGGVVVVLLAPRGDSSGRRAALQVQPGMLGATYGQSF